MKPYTLYLSRDLCVDAKDDDEAAKIATAVDEALDRILDFHGATTTYTLTAAHRGSKGKRVYEREREGGGEE